MKNQKKKNGNKFKNKSSSAWAQLSDDLVVEITSRLWLLSDQVSFRAVCKNWLQAVDQYNNTIVSLPWVIYIEASLNNIIECRLYESSPFFFRKPTLVYKINWHEYEIFPKYNLSYTECTSTQRYGWIFSSRELDIGNCYFTTFLLFSPLTKKVIILPRLANSHRKSQVCLQTFSTKPDSPDCVFLVVSRVKHKITVNIFGHGYKGWKSQEIGNQGNHFSLYRRKPVYIEGTFYFVFQNGEIASYNIALREWKVGSEFVDNSNIRIYDAFELNGELMFIGIGRDSGFINMLDRSTKTWVPLRSLGDHSIFIGHYWILVLRIGKSNYGVLPNKIYYISSYSKHSVYSLESGKLAKFSGESEFPDWANAAYPRGYWFQPPDDVLKRIKPWNSLRKLVSVQTLLPVVTEPGEDGMKSRMVLRYPQMDQIKELSTEDNELENLIVLDQMRRSRIDPRGTGRSSIKQYDIVKRGKPRKNM